MPAGVDSTYGVLGKSELTEGDIVLTSIAALAAAGMFHLQALFPSDGVIIPLSAEYSLCQPGSTFLSIFSHSSGATHGGFSTNN